MLKPGQSCLECGAPVSGTAGLGLCSACALKDALAAGATGARGGDYELLNEIARGGMGVVYRARQRSLDRVVALKVLLGGSFAGEENRTRLKNEAAVIARLKHPNIVAVHDTGELDGQPFYAMDFVAGRTLAELVRDGPLSARSAAEYVARVAGAIQYAHDHGVLHRDLKPSNVIIDPRDEPQVTDFGLARLMENAPGTVSGAVLGSPAYMSPEQALGRNREVSAASDVYALGAVLYELITGRPPFFAESPQAVLELVKTREPVAPRQLNASVPVDLETICLKCLAKEPAQRYPTARLVRGDLERFLRGEPVLARPLGAGGRAWRWARRRPALASLMALTALTLVALGVVATLSATRVRHSRDAAEARLAEALLAEARALRDTQEPGHREHVLGLVNEARGLAPARNLTVRLREEVIAALARPDQQVVVVSNVPAPAADLMLVCFDREFARCASAQPEGVIVVRVADGAVLQRLPVQPVPDEITAFSPDGEFLTVRHRGALEVWHVASATIVVPADQGEYTALGIDTFSPDSRFFARGEAGGHMAIYELETSPARAVKVNEWSLPEGASDTRLVWSPDGRSLALSSGRRVVVCDVVTGADRWRRDNPHNVLRLAWSAGHALLAVITDADRVLLLSAIDGAPVREINTPTEIGSSVEFSPGGRTLAVGSERFGSRVFDPLTGRALVEAVAGTWHLRFDATGRRLGTLFSKSQPAWLELLPSPILHSLAPGDATPVQQVLRFSPDGRYLVSLTRDGAKLWDVERRTEECSFTVSRPLGAAFDTDHRLLVSTRNAVVGFDVEPPASVSHTPAMPRSIAQGTGFWGVDASPARGWFALADHRASRVLITDREGVVRRSIDFILFPGYAAFSPEGRWLAIGAGTNVFTLDLANLDGPLHRIAGAGEVIRFSGDGRWLLTRGARVQLWQPGTWTPGPPLPGTMRESASAAAISDDSHWVATAWSDGDIQLVDLTLGAVAAVLNGPGDSRIIDLAFSPDGRHLAAARGQGEVQLWDLGRTAAELQRLGLGW